MRLDGRHRIAAAVYGRRAGGGVPHLTYRGRRAARCCRPPRRRCVSTARPAACGSPAARSPRSRRARARTRGPRRLACAAAAAAAALPPPAPSCSAAAAAAAPHPATPSYAVYVEHPPAPCVQVHRTNEWRIGVRRVEQVRGGEHAPHGTRVAQISVALRRRTTPEESLARFEEIHFFKNNRPSSHRLRSTSHPMGVNRTVLRGETVEWSGRERNNRRVETGQTHLSRLVQPHRHEINTTAPARSVDVTRTLRVLSARAEGSRSRAAPCVKVG